MKNARSTDVLSTHGLPSEAKIFGWLIRERDKVIKEMRHEKWMTLSKEECTILCSYVVEHVIDALKSMRFGHLIFQSYLSQEDVAELERKAKTANLNAKEIERSQKKRLTERRDLGHQMHRLATNLAKTLKEQSVRRFKPDSAHLSRYVPGWMPPTDIKANPHSARSRSPLERILCREPHGATLFLHRLFEKWRSTSAAEKFFLIGGPQELADYFNGSLPPKQLPAAIFHICLCGTLTSRQRNSFSIETNPNAAVTKHQIHRARKFCACVPSAFSSENWFRNRSSSQLPVVVPGLQRKLRKRA